jgi:hypothetical protein
MRQRRHLLEARYRGLRADGLGEKIARRVVRRRLLSNVATVWISVWHSVWQSVLAKRKRPGPEPEGFARSWPLDLG